MQVGIQPPPPPPRREAADDSDRVPPNRTSAWSTWREREPGGLERNGRIGGPDRSKGSGAVEWAEERDSAGDAPERPTGPDRTSYRTD